MKLKTNESLLNYRDVWKITIRRGSHKKKVDKKEQLYWKVCKIIQKKSQKFKDHENSKLHKQRLGELRNQVEEVEEIEPEEDKNMPYDQLDNDVNNEGVGSRDQSDSSMTNELDKLELWIHGKSLIVMWYYDDQNITFHLYGIESCVFHRIIVILWDICVDFIEQLSFEKP